MNWKRYQVANNAFGWLAFAVAAVTYLLTIGPTASIWDCAEFIVCVNKLEVGHPPGSPFFMLVYNVISHLTSDPSRVAFLCNATSALLSALTILFLFWTITHLLRRLVAPAYEKEPIGMGQAVVILAGGMVGALAYTFSDTFWFSAVEAEVYAFSSFFTAVVFWLILKWEDRADNERSDRWLILIAYLMGLSIGVHLLNLLCLPAMALVYYYRRAKNTSIKGYLLTLAASFALIVIMMYGIVQGVPKLGGWFDLFAVNTLGLPYNSGFYAYILLLVCSLAWGIYETQRGYAGKEPRTAMRLSVILSAALMGVPFIGGIFLSLIILGLLAWWLFGSKKLRIKTLHTVQMCLAMIFIGFASYGVILIRAGVQPPMNENDPSDAFSLRYYLAREQYGQNPLFFGPTFAARPYGLDYQIRYKQTPVDSGAVVKDHYTEVNKDVPDYLFHSEDKMLFPRLYSMQPAHIQVYNGWLDRAADDMSAPTFGDNLRFFFTYQVGFMYFRYFGWNFIGRQNDLPGDGGILRGRVMSGLPIIDDFTIGSSKNLPDFIAKNKGHNVYYCLPLLLGLLGIAFQFMRGRRGTQSFRIVFWLFLMTGLAIVVYLNQTPLQPRERDYAYAGSFYAFCIWIGLGVAGLWELLRKAKLKDLPAAGIAAFLCIWIPVQMASQNLDDHDRSGRTAARDFGVNSLESCRPDAVFFCYGDNDTFPLWYCQEVEGIRTDVRVCNLSYLGADWYIDQMKQQAYLSAPLPLEDMHPSFYARNNWVRFRPGEADPMPVSQVFTQGLSGNAPKDLDGIPLLPTDRFLLTNDSLKVQRAFAGDTVVLKHWLPQMELSMKGKGGLSLADLSVVDMIYRNDWQRPIYWGIFTPLNAIGNLPRYVRQTGMAFQMLPMQVDTQDPRQRVDMDRMYDVFMNKFRFGGAEHKGTYMDNTVRGLAEAIRTSVAPQLVDALLAAGDTVRARNVLQRCYNGVLPEVVPYDAYRSLHFVQQLFTTGLRTEAEAAAGDICGTSIRALRWYVALPGEMMHTEEIMTEVERELQVLYAYLDLAKRFDSKAVSGYEPELKAILRRIMPQAGR